MAKQLSTSLWRATGSEMPYTAKLGKHFLDLQGSHYFLLLTLVKGCCCSCLHHCFGVGCSLAHGGTLQIPDQSCILQEASEKNGESAVSMTCFLLYSIKHIFYIIWKYHQNILFSMFYCGISVSKILPFKSKYFHALDHSWFFFCLFL